MAITSNGAAPYAPTASVKEIIRRYRGRGLEIPFTKGVLRKAGRCGFADSAHVAIVQAA